MKEIHKNRLAKSLPYESAPPFHQSKPTNQHHHFKNCLAKPVSCVKPTIKSVPVDLTLRQSASYVSAEKMNSKRKSTTSEGESSGKKDERPLLICRASPTCLYKTIAAMNPVQKNDVRELGFGYLLELKITTLPLKLAHWLVSNFDARKCVLKLIGGEILRIVNDDAHRVFGFPRGERTIEKLPRGKTSELLDEWRGFFGNNRNIRPVNLMEKILEEENGGVWFKRHFLIMVVACLIENSPNGYIYPNIMGCLEDITAVKEWNWGQFLLRSLIRNRLKWKPDKAFIGPSLFLTLLYVDRVEVFNEQHLRGFPVLLHWDEGKLKNRQKSELRGGGFGGGNILGPKDETLNIVVGVETETDKMVETKLGRIISKAKLVGKHMVDLFEEIEDNSMDISATPVYQRTILATTKLLGYKTNSDKANQKDCRNPYSEDEDYWENTEALRSIEEIEETALKRDTFIKNIHDISSFSIGLPQMRLTDTSNKETEDGGIEKTNFVEDDGNIVEDERVVVDECEDIENFIDNFQFDEQIGGISIDAGDEMKKKTVKSLVAALSPQRENRDISWPAMPRPIRKAAPKMTSTESQDNGNKDGSAKQFKADWNDKNLDIFIKACTAQVRAGNRWGTHFNKVGWNNLTKDFNKQTGLSYGTKQLKSKWDLLRGDWKIWAKLTGTETGIEWDNSRQTVAASEEWWTAKIKECPEVAKFKYKGLRNLPDMEILFKEDVATEHNAWAPSEDLGDDWGRIETNNTLDTQTMDEYEDIGDPATNSSRPSERPKRKRGDNDNRRHSVGDRMCEQFDRVIECFNNDNPTTADKTTDIPTLATCLNMLKQLPGLEYCSDTHMIGIRLMRSPTNRETFVLLDDPVLQLEWIKSHTMSDVSRL